MNFRKTTRRRQSPTLLQRLRHGLLALILLGNLTSPTLAQAIIAAQSGSDAEPLLVAVCSPAGIRLIAFAPDESVQDSPGSASDLVADHSLPGEEFGPGHCKSCFGQSAPALPVGPQAQAPAPSGLREYSSREDWPAARARRLPGAMPRAPPGA